MSKEQEVTAIGQEILAQRITAAQVLANTGVNAHQTLNSLMQQNRKKQLTQAHYDKLGITAPNQAIALAMDAVRSGNHSRILARNMNLNAGTPRPQYVAAHHIVARLAWQAHPARLCLFFWGIAINDADNGVYLPRYTSSIVPSLPTASIHQHLHTDIYYTEVNIRLEKVKKLGPVAGRNELKIIKQDLICGTFPY